MINEIFKTRHPQTSLPIDEERTLIAKSNAGDKDATWSLILQYGNLLRTTANDVQSRVTHMTITQIEDLQSELVLAALETIKLFDGNRFIRLSQVLPGALKTVAMEMTTALKVPRGTLSHWFKIWRAMDHDFERAALHAPNLGMTTDTFRAISHALHFVESEWAVLPYTAGKPTADAETYATAHALMDILTPAELDVIELFYGFRGDTKTDHEVGELRCTGRSAAAKVRHRALDRMRAAYV